MTGKGVDRLSVGAGVFFVLAGVMLLLDRLGILKVRAELLWPALLIAVGAGILLTAGRRG
jgi:cell wall-active antibiotic response 4TMS protein YvqF